MKFKKTKCPLTLLLNKILFNFVILNSPLFLQMSVSICCGPCSVPVFEVGKVSVPS